MEFFRQITAGLLSAVFALANSTFFNPHNTRVEPRRDIPAEVRDWFEESASTSRISVDDQDTAALARKAYVWGWPLVYLHNCRRSLAMLSGPGVSGGSPVAPPNQLSMLSDYMAPEASAVPCPNQDVVYGFGILDLKETAVVLQVPDFGNRFWLFQLGDHRTESFAQIGSMYDTHPGHYLIVGPDWDGVVPNGIEGVLRSSTNLGFCLPRIYMDGSDEDRQQVQKLIARIQMYPVTKFNGKWKTRDWTKAKWYPSVANGNRIRSKWVDPESFFETLREVLEEVPPMPNEIELYARLKDVLDRSNTDVELRDQLATVAHQTEREYIRPLFEFQHNGIPLENGWRTLVNGAEFGSDYVTRTAVARSNIFVNRPTEAMYYYLDHGSQGERLKGDRAYKLTFPADRLPPARGFWSLTLYDQDHHLYLNPDDRYAVGTRSHDLVWNDDGSLTIYIQPEAPEAGKMSNWLPSPKGDFSLYMRVYWPESSATAGRWSPPVALSASPVRLAKTNGK